MAELGRFGRAHLAFLREFYPDTFERLEHAGELSGHLTELDEVAQDEYERLRSERTPAMSADAPFDEREAVLRSAHMLADSTVMRSIVLVAPE